MTERCNVELTAAAASALRALPREEQARVAVRIEHLVDAGLPPEIRAYADRHSDAPLRAGAGHGRL